MKLIRGRALDGIIREQGAMPIAMVQAIVTQVGSALGYAHRRGIVHRDIKPANILLDEEGSAIVTDFGIAKVPDAQALTMTGVTVGTPSYMSPEQGMGVKEISTASDQYSLGIVAFEMLTGRVPFEADSMMGIMWHHFNSPPPPLRERRPDCPTPLVDAVTRMLAKDPRARFATMEQAIALIGDPPFDDPIREHIRRLSHGDPGVPSAAQFHVPVSPAPAGASTPSVAPPAAASRVSPDAPTLPSAPFVAPHQPDGAAPDQPPVRRPRLPLLAAAAAVVLAAVVGGWLLLTHRGAPRDTAAPPVSAPAAPAVPPPVRVATVALIPSAPMSISIGSSGQLHAIPRDSAGAALGGRPVSWRSADSTVARVGTDGTVIGVAPGRATVIATIEGVQASATVIVTAGRVPGPVPVQPPRR
jgi:serine/threonine-protein kinase